ncbi:hypothetical protein V6Z11_A03G074500 [Gossypium hirsutum]
MLCQTLIYHPAHGAKNQPMMEEKVKEWRHYVYIYIIGKHQNLLIMATNPVPKHFHRQEAKNKKEILRINSLHIGIFPNNIYYYQSTKRTNNPTTINHIKAMVIGKKN